MSHSLNKTMKALKKSLAKKKKKARPFSKSRDVREDRMTIQTKSGARKK
ncbi:MAG TPA: hypothetical protein VFX30_03405 [bacterium]|nr:hypothetical protein [bacterium]